MSKGSVGTDHRFFALFIKLLFYMVTGKTSKLAQFSDYVGEDVLEGKAKITFVMEDNDLTWYIEPLEGARVIGEVDIKQIDEPHTVELDQVVPVGRNN